MASSQSKWVGRLVMAAVLGGGGYAGWRALREAANDNPPIPEHVEIQARTHALLVGCTEYPILAKRRPDVYAKKILLRGPANDVPLVRDTLHDYLGVPEANIRSLVGWSGTASEKPTRANILHELDRLEALADEGVRVIFYFSGHGTQIIDRDVGAAKEGDIFDEVILAADAGLWDGTTREIPGSIRDDELFERFDKMRNKQATVWAIFDCCHAAGMVRGDEEDETDDAGHEGIRLRQVSPSLLGVPVSDTRGGAQEPAESPTPASRRTLEGIAAFYAVTSFQKAPEMYLPRNVFAPGRCPRGLYSFHLMRALRRFGGALSLRELHEHVLAAYASHPYSTAHPVAAGALDMPAAAGGDLGEPVLIVRKDGPTLTLDAGSLRDVTVDSEVEGFQPGHLGDEEARIGRFRVSATTLTTATVVPVADDSAPIDSLPPRMPVRMHRVVPGDFALQLEVVGPQGQRLDEGAWPSALTALLRDSENRDRFHVNPTHINIGNADEPAQAAPADWRLHVRSGDGTAPPQLSLQRVEAGNGTPWLSTDALHLEANLRTVLRTENLRRLATANLTQRLPIGLDIQAFVGPEGETPLAGGSVVQPGELLRITTTNDTKVAQDVSVVMIDAAQGIQVWPTDFQSEVRIGAFESATRTLGPLYVQDDTQGAECLVILAVPQPGQKATATRAARTPQGVVEFWGLAQSPLARSRGTSGQRGADSTDRGMTAKELINALDFGGQTRGASADPQALAVKLISWHTGYGTLEIPREIRSAGIALDARLANRFGEDSDTPERPWWTGTHAAVLPSDDATASALVTWTDDAFAVYIDVGVDGAAGGDAGMGNAEAASAARVSATIERLLAGTLPVEMVLRVEPQRNIAWFAAPGSGPSFHAALVDNNADPLADLRHERGPDGWSSSASRAPWLTTRHLQPEGAEAIEWEHRMPTAMLLRRLSRPKLPN